MSKRSSERKRGREGSESDEGAENDVNVEDSVQVGPGQKKKKRSVVPDFGLVVDAGDTTTAPGSYPWIMKRFQVAFGEKVGATGQNTCPPCK